MLLTSKPKHDAMEQFTSKNSSIKYRSSQDVETDSASARVSNETEHLGSRKRATFFCGYLSGLLVFGGDPSHLRSFIHRFKPRHTAPELISRQWLHLGLFQLQMTHR
jgi:hypothetical protein